ncbi:hypothetical protein MIDIC_70086 [Alphaproteobacteria bacterium]
MTDVKKQTEEKKDYIAFYNALLEKESSGRLDIIHKESGFIGLYQMGELALIDAGYYNKDILSNPEAKRDDWSGTWTGKNGVH